MALVRYSNQARADILDIWLWIATEANVTVADQVIDRIERRVAQLEQNGELGMARPEIARDARSLVVERWLILYRLEPYGAQVIRVVDGSRELTTVLQGKS